MDLWLIHETQIHLRTICGPQKGQNRVITMAKPESTPKEGGFSNPPTKNGGQECPPPQECPPSQNFLNPCGAIQKHEHHLPHWQQGAIFYFVTWRLADALPEDKLKQWQDEKEKWRRLHPKPWNSPTEQEYHSRFSYRIEEWLDAGNNSCLLQNPRMSRIVADALRHFDGIRYDLNAFVVMPTHVHVLFRLSYGFRLEKVLHAWKGFSARKINGVSGRRGPLWQNDYWDRMIRNERHFMKCREYIRENPIKARLSKTEFIHFET